MSTARQHMMLGWLMRVLEEIMPTFRDRPYAQFNFLVSIDDGLGVEGPDAGFQEVSHIEMGVAVAENKTTDVTMKRGVIGSLKLNQWLDDIGNGSASALRTVTLQLQNEDHTAIVQTWVLERARITKHVSGPFNAKGTDVAMAELTITCERLELPDQD